MKFVSAAALVFAVSPSPNVAAQERALTKQVIVKAPLETVWKTWTTTEGVKTFFAPDARVEARPDGPFEIYFNPFAAPGSKGADEMRFLAVQDRKMVSYTWNAPPHLPEVRGQRTVVIVRFKPMGENETHLTMTHTGWGDGGQWDQAYAYFDKAWDSVLVNLRKRFDEGPIDWTEWLARMKAFTDAAKK